MTVESLRALLVGVTILTCHTQLQLAAALVLRLCN